MHTYEPNYMYVNDEYVITNHISSGHFNLFDKKSGNFVKIISLDKNSIFSDYYEFIGNEICKF